MLSSDDLRSRLQVAGQKLLAECEEITGLSLCGTTTGGTPVQVYVQREQPLQMTLSVISFQPSPNARPADPNQTCF